MRLVELLSALRARDIGVWADGERVRYSAPSGAFTPALREELTKHKADLLAFLRGIDRVQRWTPAPISRVSREAKHPPSVNQKRLWFIDRLQPNTAYNCYRAFRIRGPLNVVSLEQSLNEILRRHEALRTNFPEIDGEPFQMVAPSLKLRIPVIDLRGIVDSTESEAQKIMTAEVETPFDLAKDALFRAHLLCLGAEEHLLLLSMHHIVTDGWSLGILFNELSVFYEAFCNGGHPPLPELSIQYVDFAHWQRQWLQGEPLQEELTYWTRKLQGAPEMIALPTDYPRPAVQSFQGASEPLVISRGLTEAVQTLSRKQGVTLFMTLLAAFQVLLFRQCGQEDILVGSPIAGRPRPELERLIGFFINTLVLRTDLSGDPPFRELLRRVREVALGAYAHQEVPFEKLLEEMRLERNLSFPPLFQVLFVLENSLEQELKLSGLEVTPVTIKRETTLFDLYLAMAERREGLGGRLFYRTDLFDAASIRRMVKQFQSLLEAIVTDPERSISTLPILTGAEKHQLLVEWNDTARDYAGDKCVHELFEAQVERDPDAVAVICEEGQVTYDELNRRANQLARYLRSLGVGAEVAVGIFMDRSPKMLVALLGILKAGGAYLPLDPACPKERLAFMLEDGRPLVLLTQQRLLSRLPRVTDAGGRNNKAACLPSALRDPTVICLDVDDDRISRQSQDAPEHEITPDNLAYVIYTSGSAGAPKGIAVSHRSICNRLLWGQEFYEITPTDRVLHAMSLSFDFATWEIFTALAGGAQLVLVQPERHQDTGYLVRLIAEQNVTVAGFVPSMLEALLRESGIEMCRSLRKVMSGAEALSSSLQDLFHARLGAELQNTYGPTEATIDVAYRVCQREAQSATHRKSVPIGKPIANTRLYILDPRLQPVPIGALGELHIGGAGLARGYLKRPDLTGEKFIPDPFSKEPGERLYRTGDLARYLPDGDIEFIGRVDRQIKIRGFRIELGEIEAALKEYPAVRDTVVLAREDAPGDKRLVAYVVNRQPVETPDLRNFLQQNLPEPMIPSAFVFLDTLPLTPNGKIDRQALPPPDQNRPELEDRYVKPRTPVEKTLANIWAGVLKLERIGIHDNFFELGGHSLLATQVVSRARQTFHLDLPLRSLFESPTVAGLAERIETIQWAGQKYQGTSTVDSGNREELKL